MDVDIDETRSNNLVLGGNDLKSSVVGNSLRHFKNLAILYRYVHRSMQMLPRVNDGTALDKQVALLVRALLLRNVRRRRKQRAPRRQCSRPYSRKNLRKLSACQHRLLPFPSRRSSLDAIPPAFAGHLVAQFHSNVMHEKSD